MSSDNTNGNVSNNDFGEKVGFTKLYHPRGPLVSLPVPPGPREAIEYISLCLDVGWLVQMPGLEDGETKEQVGYVLRGSHEDRGQLTPTLLLYDTNEGHGFSFLKVYLNTSADAEAFESVSGFKLSELPEYVGQDKPERGKSVKTDQFIVKTRKSLTVIMKNNPRYDDKDRQACVAKNEIYKVPRRLFVRWDGLTPAPQSAPTQTAPPNVVTEGSKFPTPAPQPASQPQQSQTAKPVTNVNQKDTPHAMQSRYEEAIKGLNDCISMKRLNEWRDWARRFDFSDSQRKGINDVYTRNKQRIERETQEQGTPIHAGPINDKDCPF